MFLSQNSGERFQEREKIKREDNRLGSTGSHSSHLGHGKHDCKFCSQDYEEIPEFAGCSGMASPALVELMPITQRKINCTEQTVGD